MNRQAAIDLLDRRPRAQNEQRPSTDEFDVVPWSLWETEMGLGGYV